MGRQIELRGNGLLVRMTVLDEIETVAGVDTRVVEEYEAADGRVIEISRNYFAQAQDGTVCYFGEEVDIYDENGEVTSHAGAWRAGGGNVPGIFMPSSPQVGQAFHQEIAPGIAEDQAKVVALGEVTEVPGGTFEDTVIDARPQPARRERGYEGLRPRRRTDRRRGGPDDTVRLGCLTGARAVTRAPLGGPRGIGRRPMGRR